METKPEFDAFKDNYRQQIESAVSFSGQGLDFFTKAKADRLLALLDESFGEDTTLNVLDVGCGHGLIHPFLQDGRGDRLRLTGIDMAAEVIDEARQLHAAVRYDSYDGARLPYEDGRFDVAYTICVMHHVPPAQWQPFLHEMRRVVRPGGLIVVFEHNPLNPGTQYIVRTCPIDENAVLLRYGKLRGLLRDTGLRDIDGRFILFTPFGSNFFVAIDHALGRVPLGAQYFIQARVPETTAS